MNIKIFNKQLVSVEKIYLILLITIFSANLGNCQKDKEKVFVIQTAIRDLDEFRMLAKQATKLKPFGRVEINISTLAEKSFHEIPEGRNFWYEYASNNPTPYKFFPDPKIAPFLPEEFVRKNRELILAKAKILKEYGLGAAFWSYEPNFLPSAFFESYPHFLGPRVDHPRRNNKAAFAPCINVAETREMFENMVAELLKNVPEIQTFFFKTNDAGSGICWSDWQYVGPNGPMHCKDKSMGERVGLLMNTFKEGAQKSDKEITIYLTGSMFSEDEKKDIYKHLPEGCYYQSNNSDKVKVISSMNVGSFPVRGMIDPLGLLKTVNTIEKDPNQTVFITFRASYDRGYEHLAVSDRFIDMLVDDLEILDKKGEINEQKELRKICKEWGGERSSEVLFKAFTALDEAKKYKSNIGRISGLYWGVSARQITRPLVFAPQLLTPEEEGYFLPYVFNPSEIEARMDYIDIHGGRKEISLDALGIYVSKLNEIIGLMDQVDNDAPEKQFIQNMVLGLRIYSSIMRSGGNFAEAQLIRDRHEQELSGPQHRPDKTPTWEGDPDLQKFNAIMRDELDNTLDLIDVLESGGMEFISHAKDPAYEDTFLLGPDLIEQLMLKRKIMLEHWTDIEMYLTSPYK